MVKCPDFFVVKGSSYNYWHEDRIGYDYIDQKYYESVSDLKHWYEVCIKQDSIFTVYTTKLTDKLFSRKNAE